MIKEPARRQHGNRRDLVGFKENKWVQFFLMAGTELLPSQAAPLYLQVSWQGSGKEK